LTFKTVATNSVPPMTDKTADVSSKDYGTQPEHFVPNTETAAIGRITGGLPQFEEGNNVYRDWVFEVESYVFNPIPKTSLKVRILEQAGMMPVKGVHLTEGEHLLLFLNAEEDHFIIVGSLMGAKYIINDSRVRYGMIGSSPWQPLDKAVARIKAIAETWAGEKLTPERETEIIRIATNYPGISEYLADKSYETQVAPYTIGIEPGVIRYMASFILWGD